MTQNKQRGGKYQSFLEKIHGKLNTPDEILVSATKSAVGYGVKDKKKVVEGEVNEVYDITPTHGENVIVRISREKHNRFEAEKWALDKCRDVGVPVPQIHLISEVETDKEKLYICVESKIEGVSLQTLIKQNALSQNEIKELTVSAGEILSKIHSIKTKGFGELNSIGGGKFNKWSEYMADIRKGVVLKESNKIGVNTNLIQKAFAVLDKNQDVYNDTDSRLAHSDYGIKHIFIHKNKINGIIDFENCRGADIVYDFAWWNYFGKNRLTIKWLIEGYTRNKELDETFDKRMRLTKIKIALDLLIYYGDVGHDYARDITTRNITEDIAILG